MTVQVEDPVATALPDVEVDVVDDADPFDFDITFVEGTPAAEAMLACSTGDNCGTSCPSACTTS